MKSFLKYSRFMITSVNGSIDNHGKLTATATHK